MINKTHSKQRRRTGSTTRRRTATTGSVPPQCGSSTDIRLSTLPRIRLGITLIYVRRKPGGVLHRQEEEYMITHRLQLILPNYINMYVSCTHIKSVYSVTRQNNQ